MRYVIYIKSDKDGALTENAALYEKTVVVEAVDCCEAVGIAMQEASAENIDSRFLPLNIKISETE